MSKLKVFALFRNNVSYIDPLLEEFNSCPITLKVAFSVKKPGDMSHLQKVDHVFLSNSDQEKYYEANDYQLVQTDVLKHINSFKPDVIFIATSYYSPTTWLVVKYARRNRIPFFTRMTVEGNKKRNIAVKIIKKLIVGNYCKLASAGVYECDNQKKYMIEYGMNGNSLFFAPCAVDNDYYYNLKKKYDSKDLRSELGLNASDLVVAFTGQLINRKRPFDILYAYKILREKNIKLRIYFMGAGNLENTLKDYCIANGMAEDVVFLGKLKAEEMSKYLSVSNIYILPSENDASPKALNEAMNFELPIIISEGIDTAKEMCVEEENGYIVPIGNIASIADSIEKIIVNNKDNIMGKNSRKIVSQYSYKRVVNSWMNAIQYSLKERE